MTQGPWQNYGGPAGHSSDGIVVPARTSILAVSSLVFSLVCCIPGTGAIAAALGGGALVQIGRSEGRLTGKALAIVGLVLGMTTSVVWIGGALGASAVWNGLRMAVEPAIASVQSSDVTKVKSLLTTQAAAAAGDAQILKFSAAVNDKLGKFQGITANLIDVAKFYTSLSSIMPAEYLQEMQLGKSAFLPIPIDFEKGKAVIYFKLPAGNQATAQSGSFAGVFTNIIIVLPDGTRLVMLDEAAAGANAPTNTGTPPADAPTEGKEPGKKPGF